MDPLGVIGSPPEGKGTSNFISDSFFLFRYSRSLRKMLTARRLSCPSSRRARASKEQSCAVKASTFGRDDSGALGYSSRRL